MSRSLWVPPRMGDFLARLFRYRERAAISPLENFLSEALAGLLDQLPPAYGRSFRVEDDDTWLLVDFGLVLKFELDELVGEGWSLRR